MNARPQLTRIATVGVQSRVTVAGVIRSVTTQTVGPSPAVRCVLADGSGQLDLLFLGQASVAGLARGRRCTAEGRVSAYEGRLAIWNPSYELAPPESPDGPPAKPFHLDDLLLKAQRAGNPAGRRMSPRDDNVR